MQAGCGKADYILARFRLIWVVRDLLSLPLHTVSEVIEIFRTFELKINGNFSGKTIKAVLKSHFGLSEHMITLLKKGDGITVNGKKEFVTRVLEEGELLRITLLEKGSDNILPDEVPLNILYEDEDILAVNKPGDMPTHPSIYHYRGTLANAVMNYYAGTPFTFRAVTRLDRDTSGVVIIAKNAIACDKLSRQLQSGDFQKEYIAVCVGVPNPEKGRIDAPIHREKEGIIKRCIDEKGKSAISDYEVTERSGELSLVRLFPKTGRTHQLRLHLSHIGTPIFADFLYGTDVKDERIRLHCAKTSFTHPITGVKTEITAPIPNDMDLEKIKKRLSLF